MIYGFRRNAFLHDNIKDLLQAATNSDGHIRWKETFSELPVFTTVNERRGIIHEDKPAGIQQQNRNLYIGALITGSATDKTSHAIRFGAVKDMTKLPTDVLKAPSQAVSFNVGHSTSFHEQGGTKNYARGSGIDSWDARLTNQNQTENIRERFSAGPTQHIEPYIPTIIPSREVKSWKETHPEFIQSIQHLKPSSIRNYVSKEMHNERRRAHETKHTYVAGRTRKITSSPDSFIVNAYTL